MREEILVLKKIHRYSRHSVRYLWRLSALGLVIVAFLLTFFRMMTPWVNTHKAEVEHQLSLLLGEKVTIEQMETSWYWFQPTLKLNHVLVSDKQMPLLQLDQLLVGVNLWQSLLHWQIQPGLMLVDDVQLTLRQTESGWQIDGLKQGDRLSAIAPTSYWPVLRWLMLQQKIKIKHVSGEVYLKDGTLIPIHSLAIKAAHRRGHYRISGKLRVGPSENLTEFNIKGDMTYTADRMDTVQGDLFLSAEHFDFEGWKVFSSNLPYQLISGLGDTQIWVKLDQGRVHDVQSTLKFRDLEWIDSTHHQHQKLEYLDANIAWHPTEDGWVLSGDHVFVSLYEKSWPENAFIVEYRTAPDRYRLFVQKLKIDATLLRLIESEAIEPLKKMRLRGELRDTQFQFCEGKINSFLSRFSGLSWNSTNTLPAVKNLSGALYWEPSDGRLELDSENTVITFRKQKPLQFETINLSLDWKAQQEGWRFSLDRLILEHAHLVLSGRGIWDGYNQDSLGRLQASAEFSAKNAQTWLPYLPDAYLKPKLSAWLKHDIYRIGQANGRILVDGALNDFPFENAPGTFSINSSLENVSLAFHEEWPKVTEVDAHLTVDKRMLNADISKGKLAERVPVEKLNIHVSELGLGQETILVHGRIDAPGNDMLQYVLHSPLQKKLKKLSVLSIPDKLDLDLALAVPLYDEGTLSVNGSLLFDNNDLAINLALAPILLKHVLGTLFFNEQGLSQSLLQANLWDTVTRLQLQTVDTPKSSTEIRFSSDFDVAALNEQWHSPLLKSLKGYIPVEGLIRLVDDAKQWDSIEVKSTLEPLAIDLPAPFSKTIDTASPLSVKANFNFDQGIHLVSSWGERLNADIWFNGKNKQFKPARGLVCLNCSVAKAPTTSGVILEGNFQTLDWATWQKTFSRFSENSADTLSFELFQSIRLSIHSLTLLGQTYEDLLLKIHQSQTLWSVLMQTKDGVLADLIYDSAKNTVTGKIKKFVYTPSPASKEEKEEKKIPLSPNQIPNLDLEVESLYWGEKSLGKLNLQGGSQKNKWLLKDATLEAKSYVLTLNGNWLKQDLVDKTDLDATLKIRDLAAFLSIWDVPSVVMAKDGILKLKGGWPGDFRDFSVSRVSGDLALVLKNGRVTHFDPDTEKKLGLGKLLSILSLQTIPRRLKLDFSDLAYDGYSFDQFEGNFTIKNGVMSTNNSTIDGPVALVTMKGNLDLDKHLYDLDLHVSPHVTASLPVVATIAGGPIAGIATWAASKIINEGVDKVTGYTYTITGPWLEPVVQQVHIYRKKPEKS